MAKSSQEIRDNTLNTSSALTAEDIQKKNLQIQIGHKVMQDQHGTKRERIVDKKIIFPALLGVLGVAAFRSRALAKFQLSTLPRLWPVQSQQSKIKRVFAKKIPSIVKASGLFLLGYTSYNAFGKFQTKPEKNSKERKEEADNFSFPDLGILGLSSMLLYFAPPKNISKVVKLVSALRRVGVTSLLSSAYIFSQARENIKKYEEAKLLEKEAAKLVHANPKLFPKGSDDDITVYEGKNKERSLSLQSDGTFKFKKTKDYFENLSKFYSIYPHQYSLPKGLRFMYNKPTKESPEGQFAHLDIVGAGPTKFTGNKVYMNSEVLFLSDAKGSVLDKAYSQIKNEMLEKSDPPQSMMNWLWFNVQMTPDSKKYTESSNQDREKEIISDLSNWVSDKMNKNKQKNQHLFQTLDRDSSTPPEMIDVADFYLEGSGVCRHKTPVLAYLLQKAKEDGFLSGTICFKSGFNKELNTGHVWLIYSKLGEQDYLIIDPQQKVVQYNSELTTEQKAYYDKFENSLKSKLYKPSS